MSYDSGIFFKQTLDIVQVAKFDRGRLSVLVGKCSPLAASFSCIPFRPANNRCSVAQGKPAVLELEELAVRTLVFSSIGENHLLYGSLLSDSSFG